MARKQAEKPKAADTGCDILASIRGEIAECADLLRPHFLDETPEELRTRALSLLEGRYQTGRWPSDTELAELAAQTRKED